MNKVLFIIQTLIIIVLLVIVGTMALQLHEYQRAYGILSKNPISSGSPMASDSGKMISPTAMPVDQIPDFSKVTNSASNTPEVEAAIGEIATKSPTGYRVSADNKTIVYLSAEHMAEVDVASKKETELLNFVNWPKETPSETKECKPGSRFVKPTYNATENIIFFGAPNNGKDAIYIYVKGSKEAKLVTLVDDCVTDIAVSPKGTRLAYQTSTTISTLTEGYATDLYVVQADGMQSQLLAKAGKLPKEGLATGSELDFGPAEIVWPSEDVFYMKGYFLGKGTGVWKYDVAKNAFSFATNLKGGP